MLTQTCCAVRPLRSAGITLLLRYCGPSRHRLVFELPSRFFRLCNSTLLRRLPRRDEDGFSSCSACPCPRAAPTTPPECLAASVSLRRSMLPSPRTSGLGLWSLFFVEATCGFTSVAARGLAHHPEDGLVSRLHPLHFFRGCDSSYRVSDSSSGRTVSH